ncbi:hypothetical protein [Stenotrophomonas maltophilia]|uniref:hypothetical protein n=1 Tax=Stenotrophomonas maltophilia TaxID=40324 RepID=UPI0013DD0A41|nr:hypothetical protein [Stenotrophomonas maltophilia]
MNTNDKTLADAQPGGRVRLGDQAERARFEAWAREDPRYFNIARSGADYYYPTVQDAWIAWQAALSAQPSPGGQDAARYERLFLSAVEMLTKISLRLGLEPNSDGVEPMLAAIDALAARQPVASNQSSGNSGELPVDHQPVGEPVAWQVNMTRSGRGWEACTRECYEETLSTGRYMGLPAGTQDVEVRKLYAAPTAQAVDLGELREMLVGWKNSDYPFSYEGQCAQRALNACVADLQGWIDSQAVGK